MLRTLGSADVVFSRSGREHARAGASVLVAGWAQRASRRALLTAAWAGLTCLTVWTAIAAKEGRLTAPLLADVDAAQTLADRQGSDDAGDGDAVLNAVAGFDLRDPLPLMGSVSTPETEAALPEGEASEAEVVPEAPSPTPPPSSPFDAAQAPQGWERFADDGSVRWFNGRPIRPVREMWMTVTAYSPDHRSCGDSADGITATLHHVSTNGHALVAADPNVLAYGSMITVPGYDLGRVVPVLDCGGAIKGRRLDVLFPTHEQARRWGVRRVKVVVWGFADGKPAENPRKVR
jgi:3D (Asp-Asp-Asp) domain-containing protein